MRSRLRIFSCHVLGIFLATLLSACDMLGGGEGEFVQACLSEGQRGVNKRLSDEMGINRESMCKCAAKEARTALPADGYRAMILDMRGETQASREITSKMNESDRMAMLKGTLEMFGKCGGVAQ